MKILDYEGLKQVVSKLKGLIEKKADEVDLEKFKEDSKFLDTREKNENPEFYIKNYPRTITRELKRTSVMGLSVKINIEYCYLITMMGWSNSTGGYPCQYCISSNRADIYYRVGIDSTRWSSWTRVLNESDLKLKLSQLTDDSTHRLVTDTEKTKWNNKAEKSYVDSSIASVNKEINSIENKIASSLESRLKQLESALYEDITGNPFTITFNDINGLNLTNGVFNQNKARIEC